jgi:SNF2 family DNA or RNA helicase
VSFKGQLHPFQEEAVERMLDMRRLLVAYEMGLGKTVIAIAACEELIEAGKAGGIWILAPASIKLQWQHMLEQFAPDANVIVVSGDARRRGNQYLAYNQGKAEYLILNPEQMVNDWEVVSKLPRDVIIADEVTWAKNFKPNRSKKLKRLHATYQWGLTGQPVENRAEELFSIMQWIDPTVLGNFKTFDAAFIKRDYFGRVKLYRNLPTLHRLVSDHMVRRTRAEVADQLPAVVEPEPILVDADADTSRLYRRMVHDLEAELAEAISTYGNFSLSGFYHGDDQGEARGRIMSKMVCMRMLCDHPELLRLSAAHFRGVLPGARTGSMYAEELHQAGRLERLPKAPKLAVTVDLIRDILDASPENKVVLFSFFRDMLDLIAAATQDSTTSVLFTGAVSQRNRDKAKQQFVNDPSTRLFLSSDAGGIGLDLPVANYLISYDLPWSAGAFAQRQSRIIRLSSTFPQVTLLSVQVTGSIEQYQHRLLGQKKKVADAVIDGRGINPRGRLTLDLASLSQFLQASLV